MFLHQFAHRGTNGAAVLPFYSGEHAVWLVYGQDAIVVLAIVICWTTDPIERIATVAESGVALLQYCRHDAWLYRLRELHTYHVSSIGIGF